MIRVVSCSDCYSAVGDFLGVCWETASYVIMYGVQDLEWRTSMTSGVLISQASE